jgi:hypothetical protein
MTLLIQLTTEYSTEEDRLCLTGRDEAECVYKLWLTRRLADRLFYTSIDWLQKQQQTTHVRSNLVQTFEQEHAVAEIEPQARVSAPTESSSSTWLVNNVDLCNKKGGGLILVFKDAHDQDASVAFETIELRQWLSICCKVYQAAGWPLEIWPSWMVNDPVATTSTIETLVH